MARKTVKSLEQIIASKDNEIKILTAKLINEEKIKLNTIEDMLYMQDLRHDTQLKVLRNDCRLIIETKINELSKLKQDYDKVCMEKDNEVKSLETKIDELTVFRHEEVEHLKNYIDELASQINKLESTRVQNNTRIEIILYHLKQFIIDKFHKVETQKIKCCIFQKLFQKYLKSNKIPYLGRNEIHYTKILMKGLGFKNLINDPSCYKGLQLK